MNGHLLSLHYTGPGGKQDPEEKWSIWKKIVLRFPFHVEHMENMLQLTCTHQRKEYPWAWKPPECDQLSNSSLQMTHLSEKDRCMWVCVWAHVCVWVCVLAVCPSEGFSDASFLPHRLSSLASQLTFGQHPEVCRGLTHWWAYRHLRNSKRQVRHCWQNWSESQSWMPESLFLVLQLFFLIPDPQNPPLACPGSLTECLTLHFFRLICPSYYFHSLSKLKLAITEGILNTKT